MSNLKAYKYRLYPNKKQAETLQWTLDRARELYNSAIQERRDAYEIRVKRHPNYHDEETHKHLTQERALTYRRIGFLACGEFDFDRANLGEADPLILSQRKARLWKREGVIAPVSMKTRIAGCFPHFDSPKKCLVCLIHPP